jgi:hypothetical protein
LNKKNLIILIVSITFIIIFSVLLMKKPIANIFSKDTINKDAASKPTIAKASIIGGNINKLEKDSKNVEYALIDTQKPDLAENQNKLYLDKKGYLKIVNKNANALVPLKIKTSDGYNQPMHPDILYIDNGFKGYKYWMAYTPYPFMIDRLENPCIAVSNDGINWVTPTGLKNPIVLPPKDTKDGGHYSDTDIIYDNGKLVVYYVYNKRGVFGPSKFYRSISSDGITWTKPELIYQCQNPISGYSPAFMKEGNLYNVWYISEGNIMSYCSSSDSKNWSSPVKCNINIKGWQIWHLDIIKTETGYEGLICARDNHVNNRALFHINSTDGINWTTSNQPIIYPTAKGWDSAEIYRSTMLKQNGLYRVWYSARGALNKWGIGYSEGKTMETLQGYKG